MGMSKIPKFRPTTERTKPKQDLFAQWGHILLPSSYTTEIANTKHIFKAWLCASLLTRALLGGAMFHLQNTVEKKTLNIEKHSSLKARIEKKSSKSAKNW